MLTPSQLRHNHNACKPLTLILLYYSGNGIVIASTIALNLSLTWGGVQYPWASYRVLVPLLSGIAGLGVFMVYETRVSREPIVPQRIWGNRTTGSGYVLVYSLVFTHWESSIL